MIQVVWMTKFVSFSSYKGDYKCQGLRRNTKVGDSRQQGWAYHPAYHIINLLESNYKEC